MFVEEGFRVRFGNGEIIDFYADSAAEKEGWMKVLSETVGKGNNGHGGDATRKSWTDLVLAREKRQQQASALKAAAASPPTPAPAPTPKLGKMQAPTRHSTSGHPTNGGSAPIGAMAAPTRHAPPPPLGLPAAAAAAAAAGAGEKSPRRQVRHQHASSVVESATPRGGNRRTQNPPRSMIF